MELVVLLAGSGLGLVCAWVCREKGKSGLAVLGLVSAIPGVTAFLVWVPLVGALRLARPGSTWARERYDETRMTAARGRFPGSGGTGGRSESVHPSATPTSAVAAGPMDFGPARRRSIIRRFLADAHEAGILTDEVRSELMSFLSPDGEHGPAPTTGEPTPERSTTVPPPPPVATPRRAPPRSRPASTTPAPTSPSRPAPPAAVTARSDREPVRPTPEPRPPGPVATRAQALWEALVSDVAVHGFMYLGVLVTVVAIVGFLVFSFASVPDAQQPFFEFGIATILFGWSWILRRNEVTVAATAMELVAGIVLPLVVFAGLVDGVAFPPDAQDGALIVALVATALVLAGVYALVSARRPSSALRFLVAPMVWLAAMAAGFVFKTDELLASDAITRLVSPQPALAAVAIAVTVALVRRRPEHRLAGPTTAAALVGLPVAWLLTIGLAAGESWARPWATALLGVATLAGAELLARHFERTSWLPVLRPILLAGVIAPLSQTLGPGWTAVVLVASYGGLLESELRRPRPSAVAPVTLASTGLLVGSAVAVLVPWATTVVFTVLTVWAHHRRRVEDADLRLVFLALAALLPIGAGVGLVGLLPSDEAWLLMSAVGTGLAVVVRVRGVNDAFWPWWLSGAAAVVAGGTVASWAAGGQQSWLAVVAVGLTAATLGLAPRPRPARFWGCAVALAGAASMAVATAAIPGWQATLLWGGAGLLLVVDANVRGGGLADHRALLGHLIGAATLLALPTDWAGALVLWAWTLAWVVSATRLDEPDSVTALLDRLATVVRDASVRVWRPAGPPGRQETDTTGTETATTADETGPPAAGIARAAWFTAGVATVSVPAAVITTANLWPAYVANRPWTGVTLAGLAVLHALAARASSAHQLTWWATSSAIVMSLLGVAVAVPAPWSMLAAATAVIGVAALLRGTYDRAWLVWLAWSMSTVVAVLIAERAGVPPADLHQVAAVWGAVLFLGGLLLDDVRAGRRGPGEGLRTSWVRHPVLVGGLVLPVSVAPVFARPASVYGWWALAGAVVYLVAAGLLRMGAVAAPSYALVVVAAHALLPWSLLGQPWLLAPIAAVLLLAAWAFERRGPATSDLMARWDLPPFVVAHAVAAFALAAAVAAGDVAVTALALTPIALAVAAWRRHRGWVVAANVLVLLAAVDVGSGWLSLALLVTAAHGIVGVRQSDGAVRVAYQGVAVVATGLAWLDLLAWWGPAPVDGVNASALVFGGVGLLVAGAARARRLATDSLVGWGGLALIGVSGSVVAAAVQGGSGVAGPWLALATTAVAAGFHLAAPAVRPSLRFAAVPTAGLAWGLLVVGLGWSTTVWVAVTALAFGALAAVAVEVIRSGEPRDVSAAALWAALGAVGVCCATVVHVARGGPAAPAVAAALAVLAVASARAWSPLGMPPLRDASPLLALGAADVTIIWAGWSQTVFATVTVVVAAGATGVAVASWRRDGDARVRPALVLATAANLQAAGLALAAWPARSLAIAVLASIGVQAIAVGMTRRSTAILACGPPLLGVAFALGTSESLAGSAQWFTVPSGLVLLSEVEILRLASWGSGVADRPPRLDAALEWTGIAFLAGPPLVEAFTRGPAQGLVAGVVAVALLVWGLVTRVRRRIVAAGSLAVVTAVLILFAVAASATPTARTWVVAAGIGFAVMMASAWVEAWRSRRGRLMSRLGDLMEGWE